MTSFFQRAGKGISEEIMDPSWQENSNKYRPMYVFAWFSSAFALTWARGHAIQNSTFNQTQCFLVKSLQLLAVQPVLDDSHHGGVKDVTVTMLLKAPVCSEEQCYVPTITKCSCGALLHSRVNIYKQFGFPLSKFFFQTNMLLHLHLFLVISTLEQIVSCKFWV